MRRSVLALVLMTLLTVGGCGGSDPRTDDSRPGAAAFEDSPPADLPDPHYAMFPGNVPGSAWELTEAVRMRGNDREDPLGGLPGVDWYAEFRGPEVDEDTNAYLSLTGYTQSLEERRTESVSTTSDVTAGEINGNPAFWTSDPGDPDSGALVTWEVAPGYTLELFATGVPMDNLVALAKTVKKTSEAEWTAAEGKVAGCAPTAQDCAG